MSKSKLKLFSFFSGSGFLDLGFEKSGFDIDFVNEISPSFLNAYRYSRQVMELPAPRHGYHNTDITEYLTSGLEILENLMSASREGNNLIGFIGGPPCPDFSVGGKNKGRHGENGRLSSTYIELIIKTQPDFFLFENVKGLWKTAKHRAFYEELKARLAHAGYVMTERLTNALEFGVPQDRDRIFLFGILRKHSNSNQYKESSLVAFPWSYHIKYNLDVIKKMPWPETVPFKTENTKQQPYGILPEITIEYWFEKNRVTSHPNSGAHFKPRDGIVKMQTIDEGDVSKKSYKRLHRWRYSPTAAYGNNEVHLHPYEARRISASEAMAIQSLPGNFELPQSMCLTDMFKTIGNGVPYLLATGIAKTIRHYLESLSCKN